MREGAVLGHHAHLCRYETERQQANVPTMFSIDALQKLYGTSLPPVVLVRWRIRRNSLCTVLWIRILWGPALSTGLIPILFILFYGINVQFQHLSPSCRLGQVKDQKEYRSLTALWILIRSVPTLCLCWLDLDPFYRYFLCYKCKFRQVSPSCRPGQVNDQKE